MGNIRQKAITFFKFLGITFLCAIIYTEAGLVTALLMAFFSFFVFAVKTGFDSVINVSKEVTNALFTIDERVSSVEKELKEKSGYSYNVQYNTKPDTAVDFSFLDDELNTDAIKELLTDPYISDSEIFPTKYLPRLLKSLLKDEKFKSAALIRDEIKRRKQ